MKTICTRGFLIGLAALSLLRAQTQAPISGKFYQYYTVASTANGQFTALGAPSINDYGLLAFMGETSIGQTIWTGDGDTHPLVDINPGSGNPGGLTFAPQMQINTNNTVIARDEINGTSSNIRAWNANETNSFTYLARAGEGQAYNATYQAASINKSGASVFAVINSSGQTELVENATARTSFAINTGTPQPVIATNGNMVITTTNTETELNQITVFANDFASQTDIADGTNFSYLDTAPGISEDGNVVVFQGTLTATGATNLAIPAGPGIFAATYNGTAWQITRITGLMIEQPNSGGNGNGVCETGEVCVNAAELGYNEAGKAVYFSAYPTNSRVAVANLTLGAAGIANDSFVISFVATPSSASRTNPWLPGTPLLFSAQQGLWTIRVDVENQLSPPNSMVVHPYTAIPVAQIGDQIGSGIIVASIGVNQQIANAAEDESGNIRTMRRGDHRVAFQITTTGGDQIIFRANHLDSDADGLLDHWETTGIDMDQDGTIDLNLAAMGANPNKRDLFLQIDWLADQPTFNFQPAPGVIMAAFGVAGSLPTMYLGAPPLTGDMYGVRSDGAAPAEIPAGINMHIDGGPGNDANGAPLSYNMIGGPLNGGNQIGLSGAGDTTPIDVLYFGASNSIDVAGVNTKAFQDAKNQNFGSLDKDARELAFKYAILASHHSFMDSPPAGHPVASAGVIATGTYEGYQYIISGNAVASGMNTGHFVKIATGTGAGQIARPAGFPTANPDEMIFDPGTFDPLPDSTSTIAYLSGSGGRSELFVNPTPDFNSLGGNDVSLDLGGWGVNPNGGYLMNTCTQWRTLAHELGHTLGLRHGGIDNVTNKGLQYLSLMSYSWQLQCNVVSQVQAYSTTGDPTFDDFANLNMSFPEVLFFVGNTLGEDYGFGDGNEPTPEQTVLDYINQNGSIDFTKPSVAINSPATNSQVGIGGPLPVSVTATDNVSVASVQISFDANGDGTIEPDEILHPKASGTGSTYNTEFATISGSPGTRVLTAIATDTSGNTATTSINLSVINPNSAPVLQVLNPSSATHGGAAFLVTITGTGFLDGCTGQWNGLAHKTTFVSSTEIKMGVLASDIAAAGSAQVTVANPAEGANKSNALTFTIN
jgi:hypothetical protein